MSMNNRRPAYFWISIIVAVLLFLVLAVFIIRDEAFLFTSINSAVISDETVLGVDSEGAVTTVFKVSTDTGIGDYLRIPFIVDKQILTISDPYICGDAYYFRQTACDMEGGVTESLVRWNLEKARLEKVEIPVYLWKRILAWEDSAVHQDENSELLAEVDSPEDNELKGIGKVRLFVRRKGEDVYVNRVHRESGKMRIRLILAFLFSVLVYAVIMVLCSLAGYYHYYPGFIVRMGVMVITLMTVLIIFYTIKLGNDLYTFSCNHMLAYCTDSATMRTFAINRDILESFLKDETSYKDTVDKLWKYDLNKGFRETESDEIELMEEEASEDWKVWQMYDNRVVTEEHSVILKKDSGYIVLTNEQNTNSPWLLDPYLTEKKHVGISFSEKKVQSLVTIIGRQRYAVSFVPTKMDSGAEVIVATRVPMNSIFVLNFHMSTRTINILQILCVASFIIVMSGIFWALWPIDELQKAIKEITAGNFKARTKCTGFNELHYLARLFNLMADQLEKQSEGTDSYRIFYNEFLPASLIRRLSGRSVPGSIEPDSIYRMNACSLVVDTRDHSSSQEESTGFFETAVHIAEEHGGHLASVDDDEIKIICTESPASAMRTATNLQQKLLVSEKPFAWSGIAYSPVTLRVIGNDGRRNVVEQDSDEAEILSRIAAELKIPVILSGSIYMDAVRNTAKLHFRCLGRIGCGDYIPDAPLYELLDANTASTRAIREYSKSVFERGVNAYSAGDYFTARNEMIRALELDPKDLAARCYVLNCDRKEPPTVCQITR